MFLLSDLVKVDPINRMITLTVIALNGFHCIIIFLIIIQQKFELKIVLISIYCEMDIVDFFDLLRPYDNMKCPLKVVFPNCNF